MFRLVNIISNSFFAVSNNSYILFKAQKLISKLNPFINYIDVLGRVFEVLSNQNYGIKPSLFTRFFDSLKFNDNGVDKMFSALIINYISAGEDISFNQFEFITLMYWHLNGMIFILS